MLSVVVFLCLSSSPYSKIHNKDADDGSIFGERQMQLQNRGHRQARRAMETPYDQHNTRLRSCILPVVTSVL